MTVTTRHGTEVLSDAELRQRRASQSPAKAVKEVRDWAASAGTGDRHGVWGLSGVAGEVAALAGTVILMLGCPAFALYMWYTLTHLDGSVTGLLGFIAKAGWRGVWDAWPTPSWAAWAHVAVFGIVEAALQLLLPGKIHKGPITPKGNVPVYKANGVQAFFTTIALFLLGCWVGVIDPARIYDLMGEILSALNRFSLGLCAFLYIKGRFAPSSSDSGTTGSFVYDIFWGMELYPRIGRDLDIKTWTNCRMGMMGWAVLILAYALRQYQAYGSISDSMLVSVTLMELYVFKFFLWETGYWGTMDIMHDRAGYYLCWGCLNWISAIYTSPALYLAGHPITLGRPLAAAFLIAGMAAIYINYDADRQRQVFRATNGQQKVWGREPSKIVAKYTTGDGQEKTSLLLSSGWWGLSRHFHYLPEISAAVFWTIPVHGLDQCLVYFYPFFLTLLLLDRAYRDDVRCSSKYGKFWKEYCRQVPYKVFPFIW